MSILSPVLGDRAGLRAGSGATPRAVFWGGCKGLRPGGGFIDSVLARDVGNTSSNLALRAGLIMGSVTATGRFANSYLGLTTAAYAAAAGTLTVSLLMAAELLRRNGAAGNLSLIGPPAANSNAVTNQTVPYTAINTATGVITVTGAGITASVIGSLVGCADGSEIPDSFINDGYPIRAANTAAGTDVPGSLIGWPDIPEAGDVNEDYLLPLPTDLGILNWLRRNLNGDPTTNPGKCSFIFRRAVAG